MQPATLLEIIRGSRKILIECDQLGAGSGLGVTQEMIETCVANHPSLIARVGALVRHLNKNKLRLTPLDTPAAPGRRSTTHLCLSSQRRAEIVQDWLDAQEGGHLRNSAVGLLCMFYPQRPDKILSLRKHQLRDQNDEMEIDFGYGWEPIDPSISTVVRRWMATRFQPSRFRKVADSDFLFPGQAQSRGFSKHRFRQWLRSNYGVTIHQLYATAVHGLIEAGLTDPGALIAQFGMNPRTAIKYWLDSGRDVGSLLYAELLQGMRESGDLPF